MFTPSRGRILIFLFLLSMASVPLGSTRASAGTITAGGESYSASAPPAAPAPYRVAVQIGHYKNSELPEALSRLSGHTGAYGGGRSEVDLNYDVAQRLAAILRGKGVVVDIVPATIQTGYTADAFVAVHADGNSSAAARG